VPEPEKAFLGAEVLAASLVADWVDCTAWTSRIGRARRLDEVGECIFAIRSNAQTDGDLGDKPPGPISLAGESNAISSAYPESFVEGTSDRGDGYLSADLGRKQRLNG